MQVKVESKMSRVKAKVIDLIAENTGLSRRTISRRINAKREELGFMYSRRIAAYVYAIDQGIDVSSFMSEEERKLVKDALGSGTRIVRVERKQKRSKEKKVRVVRFSDKFKLECPNLPSSVIEDAKRMADIYPYLYIFENSVRYFIINTLQKYGDDWWYTKVSNRVKKKAQKRMEQEDRHKWHGKRGQHPIFYTNISDLKSIIQTNYEDFKDKLPSIEWLTQRINEIELSRNTVAHNNPLHKDDIERIKIFLRDWINQISQ
ncbi:MAG: hypothetical protein DRI26_08240 [Chloroflexi bacterium]|nr:MAG: hypothetical protein DRI26_08240 [Chloroflexota bacterium]